jgi:hypothetical protein
MLACSCSGLLCASATHVIKQGQVLELLLQRIPFLLLAATTTTRCSYCCTLLATPCSWLLLLLWRVLLRRRCYCC